MWLEYTFLSALVSFCSITNYHKPNEIECLSLRAARSQRSRDPSGLTECLPCSLLGVSCLPTSPAIITCWALTATFLPDASSEAGLTPVFLGNLQHYVVVWAQAFSGSVGFSMDIFEDNPVPSQSPRVCPMHCWMKAWEVCGLVCYRTVIVRWEENDTFIELDFISLPILFSHVVLFFLISS